MPFTVNDPALDQRLDRLIEAQVIWPSRASMVAAIVDQVIRRFEETGNPDSWKTASSVPPAGAVEQAGHLRSGDTQSNPAPQCASDVPSESVGADQDSSPNRSVEKRSSRGAHNAEIGGSNPPAAIATLPRVSLQRKQKLHK